MFYYLLITYLVFNSGSQPITHHNSQTQLSYCNIVTFTVLMKKANKISFQK